MGPLQTLIYEWKEQTPRERMTLRVVAAIAITILWMAGAHG